MREPRTVQPGGRRPTRAAGPVGEAEDPFEAWDRHPVNEAEENIGYQKLAWYAAPFGDAAISLLLLAFIANGARRAGRWLIRLLVR